MGQKDINYNYSNHRLDKGILVGLEEIPVNESIIRKMKKIYFENNRKIDENYIINNIKNNCHNDITAIYYLLLKKLEGIKDNIHYNNRVKIFNTENNIRNININYINHSEFNQKEKLNKTLIKQKI